jgi:oxygen-independent coproporphyrinogen-3 oxidase
MSVDLIAGLPHQTRESWLASLDDVIATGVPHVSVYMLEVDEDSRLGKELLAGGQRYHAHFVPKEDDVAEFYELACERLNAAAIAQYEISNFARAGHESKHNLKYWTREPYIGFGVDAHSMLLAAPHFKAQGVNAIRLFTPGGLEEYLAWDGQHADEVISELSALEETMFLGLRLNRGVDLNDIEARFAADNVDMKMERVLDLLEAKLVEFQGRTLKLTAHGRLLSNEVFEKFISIGTIDDVRDILGLDPDAPLPQVNLPEKIQ